MAGAELGTYYIQVVPSTRGAAAAIATGIGVPADRAAGGASRSLARGMSTGAAAGAASASRSIGTVGAAVDGVGGKLARLGAAGGLVALGSQAVRTAGDMERSEAAVAGLYEDTELAAATMSDLRDVAKDSSLQFAGFQRGAASIAYLGVQGDRAVAVLENIGKAIVGAGGGTEKLDQAANALSRMQAAGKVQLDTIQQLSRSGVPILSALQAHFGTTRVELNRMISAGKVGFEDVIASIEGAMGEWFPKQIAAADEAEKKWSATWARMKDNMAVSLGDAVLPILEALTPVLEGIGTAVSAIPSPMITAGLAVGGLAAASSVLQGAIARNVLGLGTLAGALARNATSAGIASAASAGFAAALSREAEAAGVAAAAHGTLAGARGRGAILGGIGNALSKTTTRLGLVAAALYGVGKGAGWLTDKLHGSRPGVEEMSDALLHLGRTGEQTGAMLEERGGLDDLTESIKRFKANSDGVDGAVNKVTDVIAKVGTFGAYSGHSTFDQLTKDINLFDEGLAQMVQSGNVDEAKAAFQQIESHLLAEGLSGDDVTRFFNDYLDAADRVPPANEEIGSSAEGAAGGLSSLGETAEEAAENWRAWVEENGALAALQNVHGEAAALKSILDEVAGSMGRALGVHLSPAMAQDEQARAQKALNDAIAEAREKGYTGDYMNLADQSQAAIDLRDKHWALQQATADLAEAWMQAGADGETVEAMLRRLGDQFADTTGIYTGKSAVDDYIGSIWIMIAALEREKERWDEVREAREQTERALKFTFDERGRLQAPEGTWTPAEWQSMFPGRARGGPVAAGELYRVNELGGARDVELFRPRMDGVVIPLGGEPSGGEPTPFVMHNTFVNPEPEPASVSLARAGRQLAASIGGS